MKPRLPANGALGRALRLATVLATTLATTLATPLALSGCHAGRGERVVSPSASPSAFTKPANEVVRVLRLDTSLTATLVYPTPLAPGQTLELVVYALPNGNSTAETMGRLRADSSVGWRFDIQHIAAQSRALRARGVNPLLVVYLEANSKSWPTWRQSRGYDQANRRIRQLVGELRDSVAQMFNARDVRMALTGHSGGGSFLFGVIEAPQPIPTWVDRIAFLDANYNFAPRHGPVLSAWLAGHPERRLLTVAYDDRNIMLDGKKVVSDSGGTWRASERMVQWFGAQTPLVRDSAGEFLRWRSPAANAGLVEVLLHPNPANRILHTEMIGEMNAFMYVMLAGRTTSVQPMPYPTPPRAYTAFVQRN